MLAGINDKFPLSLWCNLLEPIEFSLNILWRLRVVPNISAYAHVQGPHNYMCKPFAHFRCPIQAHVKPKDRRSRDTRSNTSFNLGTSMEHHPCFHVYITRTGATRVSNTVYFKHLTISPESHVVAAAQQLMQALKGNIPAGNKMAEALTKASRQCINNT